MGDGQQWFKPHRSHFLKQSEIDYEKATKFLERISLIIERAPKAKERHELFLCTANGVRLFLELAIEPSAREGLTQWRFNRRLEGYLPYYCSGCTWDDPCVEHQEEDAFLKNSKEIRLAKHAREIGLDVLIPAPQWPTTKRAFSSLESFKEVTRSIFPVYSRQGTWTFPRLPIGLFWNKDRQTPCVYGYSGNGKVYRKTFRFDKYATISTPNLLKLLLADTSRQYQYNSFVLKLTEVTEKYKKVRSRIYKENQEASRKQADERLRRERAYLARHFKVPNPYAKTKRKKR